MKVAHERMNILKSNGMCFTVQHSEMTITVPTIIETIKTKQANKSKPKLC